MKKWSVCSHGKSTPLSGGARGEFKTQSAELQTRNSTAKREWHFSETESR